MVVRRSTRRCNDVAAAGSVRRLNVAAANAAERHDVRRRCAEESEERRAVLSTMGTPDQREGIQAFLEKRKPRFNRESQ